MKNDKSLKILLLSAPIGSGHIRAAHAVGAALEQLDPRITCQYADVFDFVHPMIGKIILKSYLNILKIFPQAYGMAYGWGNTSSLALYGRNKINKYLAAMMYDYIRELQPDAIVCTHATPAGLAARLIHEAKIHVPVMAVVTDFVVHRLWVYHELSYYFVAHEALRMALAEKGISFARSHSAGIPVDAAFAGPDKPPASGLLGLNPDKPTVMLMGGGAGVLPMENIIAACDKLGQSVQFILITGNNHQLYQKLIRIKRQTKHCLHVFGYVNNVAELMEASDVLISKPGGMTSAEALCSGLPLILYKPIPGQEEANARYLAESQVALRADTLKEVVDLLECVLADPIRLAAMKRNAFLLAKPDAASQIAQKIRTLALKL